MDVHVSIATPRTRNSVFKRWSPLEACPELLIPVVFAEAQLYMDGSTIKEGTVGDFLKGKETKSSGAIVGTNDGDTYFFDLYC